MRTRSALLLTLAAAAITAAIAVASAVGSGAPARDYSLGATAIVASARGVGVDAVGAAACVDPEVDGSPAHGSTTSGEGCVSGFQS
jgi:hypothetical protein